MSASESDRLFAGDRDRHVSFDGCFNFRDLGGYSAGDGQRVRWDRLYRSDRPHRLTQADPVGLAKLGIVTVIDLRATSEVRQSGRFEIDSPAISYHHVPLYDLPPLAVVERFFEVDPAEAARPSYMAEVYEAMVYEGMDAVATALALLAEPEALPALVHCSGGKDRTGIFAAVVLRLLGVGIDDVADDYAMSQPAMDEMFAWMRANSSDGPEVLKRCTPVALRAERTTMVRLLERLEDRCGSMEALVSTAGVTADTVERLRGALLERDDPLRLP